MIYRSCLAKNVTEVINQLNCLKTQANIIKKARLIAITMVVKKQMLIALLSNEGIYVPITEYAYENSKSLSSIDTA